MTSTLQPTYEFLADSGGGILFVVVALALILLLCITRFNFMVFVCFCLLGIVRVEPAPVDGLVLLLLLVGLLTGKLSLKALRGSSFIHLTLWIFLLANLISLATARTFSDSLRFLVITVYLIIFAYFVKMYVTSFQAMRTLLLGYLVSVTINTLFIILGYFRIGPFSELFLQGGIRAVGAFKDPNVFGPFIIPVALLLIDEILYPRILPKFFLAKLLGVGILVVAVFLSFSRAAWANLALAVAIYFIINIGRLFQIKLGNLIRGGTALLIVTIGSLRAFEPRLGRMDLTQILAWRLSSHDYDLYRFDRQKEGIEAGLTHLFGVGPGTWDNAHSLYVRTFAEHGILGLASLIALILVLIMSTFRRALNEVGKPYGLSATVVLACLVGLVLNSLVIDTIHWRHLWLIVALAWAVCTQPDIDRSKDLRQVPN
jgi:hypothetical protein